MTYPEIITKVIHSQSGAKSRAFRALCTHSLCSKIYVFTSNGMNIPKERIKTKSATTEAVALFIQHIFSTLAAARH